MHRLHIDAWLTELDGALAEGLHRDPDFLERARGFLRSDVVADNDADARWLSLQLGDLERQYGVNLRAPSGSSPEA